MILIVSKKVLEKDANGIRCLKEATFKDSSLRTCVAAQRWLNAI